MTVIDDTIIDAMDALIELCSDRQQELGMCSIRELLCDLYTDEFPGMSDEEKEAWLEQFLSCPKKGGKK